MIHEVMEIIDDQPCFEEPLADILAELQRGGALQTLTPLETHTTRQRAWFKGVLLPALSKDNGESKRWWEIKLIETIFPDDVEYVNYNNRLFPVAQSISSYGKKKMATLIEESVAQCHTWGLTWVTLPDSEKRK
jgi:hypothetical protein